MWKPVKSDLDKMDVKITVANLLQEYVMIQTKHMNWFPLIWELKNLLCCNS